MLRPLNKLLKVAILLILIWVTFGLILTPSYHAQHSIAISQPAQLVKLWLDDLSRWPSWLALTQLEPEAQLNVPAQHQGVGANIYWTGERSQGELSIISVSESELKFQVLVNNEYLSRGVITLTPTAQGTTVSWSQTGDISIPVFGPYFAWIAQHQLKNTITHSLNNLKTHAELPNHTKSNEEFISSNNEKSG